MTIRIRLDKTLFISKSELYPQNMQMFALQPLIVHRQIRIYTISSPLLCSSAPQLMHPLWMRGVIVSPSFWLSRCLNYPPCEVNALVHYYTLFISPPHRASFDLRIATHFKCVYIYDAVCSWWVLIYCIPLAGAIMQICAPISYEFIIARAPFLSRRKQRDSYLCAIHLAHLIFTACRREQLIPARGGVRA